MLELFHGPTAAFKDFGARFLAETLQRLETGTAQPLTILVATSGDTGGAVAAAFHRRPWVRIVILYPKGSGERAPGAAAHLLGRQRDLAAHRRHVRRLPAAGEGGLRRLHAARPGIASARRTASTSAACCRRLVYYAASSLEVERRTGTKRVLHHSGRQSRQCLRRRVGAGDRISHRAHRSSRTTPIARCRISCRAAIGGRARASRRSPRPWTSAIRATWSASARSIRRSPR